MSFLGKEYKFSKQENFDTFLKVVGVPEDKIPALASFVPSQKLVQDGDSYTYYSETPEGPKETTFKSGVEFDDVIGPQQMPIKTTYVVDGDTVTQTITGEKGQVTFVREYSGDELLVTITAKGWDGVSKRYYQA